MNKIKELRTQMKNITKKMTYLTFCVNKRESFSYPKKRLPELMEFIKTTRNRKTFS